MGNYEHYEFGCVVTLNHCDLGYTDQEAQEVDTDTLATELSNKCMEVLNGQLEDEIREAQQLTDAEKSFVLESFTSRRPRTRRRER